MKEVQFYPAPSELPLLLDGRQTALVRPMAPQPRIDANIVSEFPSGRRLDMVDSRDFPGYKEFVQSWDSPFGPSGTKLWCKERWWSDWKSFDEGETELCYAHEQAYGEIGVEWSPSINMPKTACRLWLQVLELKVIRVHDVTEEMAKSLGCDKGIYMDGPNTERGDFQLQRPFGHSGSPYSFLDGFKYDYQSLYGRKSWESDSWIWYATVKRIEKP